MKWDKNAKEKEKKMEKAIGTQKASEFKMLSEYQFLLNNISRFFSFFFLFTHESKMNSFTQGFSAYLCVCIERRIDVD